MSLETQNLFLLEIYEICAEIYDNKVSLCEFARKLPKYTQYFTTEYQLELWQVLGLIESTVFS